MRATLASFAVLAAVLTAAVAPAAARDDAPYVNMYSWSSELVMAEGCNTAGTSCSPGWLAPVVPGFDLRGPGGVAGVGGSYWDPYTTSHTTPLHIASGAYDIDGNGTYETPAAVSQSFGSDYYDPLHANTFTLGANAAVPPTLAPTYTVRAQATADDRDGTTGTSENTVPVPARRVRVAWDNGAKIDLHVWKPGANGTDRGADHAYFNAPYGVPNGTIMSSRTGALSGLQSGVGPYAFVDYPTATWTGPPATPSLTYTYARPDGYTIGVCQYEGSGATVTVTITEADGTSRNEVRTLGAAKSAWLVGTTGGVPPVIQNGWCNGNEPTVAGGTSEPVPVVQSLPPGGGTSPPVLRPPAPKPLVPSGALAKAKVRRGKALTVTFRNLPKRAMVKVSWAKKGKKPKALSVRVRTASASR
jgi:hypothetical protein